MLGHVAAIAAGVLIGTAILRVMDRNWIMATWYAVVGGALSVVVFVH